MKRTQLNLIVAACENMGIGANGTLPWRLKKEMAYFATMTRKVQDPTKQNAVIMGRKTWDSIPVKYRPLSGRVNIVLTHQVEALKEKTPEEVVVVSGLDEAIAHIEKREDIESTWVIGGLSVYEAAMSHPCCGKIYLTEILASFECDTFFPRVSAAQFRRVTETDVPVELQHEDGITYYYRVYQKL